MSRIQALLDLSERALDDVLKEKKPWGRKGRMIQVGSAWKKNHKRYKDADSYIKQQTRKLSEPKKAERKKNTASDFIEAQGIPAEKRADANEKINRILTLRQERGDEYEAFVKGDLRKVLKALDERGKISSLLEDYLTSEVPGFDIRGAVITSPRDFARFSLALRTPYVETVKVAVVDEAGQVVHSQILNIGAVNESIFNVASIPSVLKTAQTKNPGVKLAGWLLAHNHPTGDPSPSQADKIATRRAVEMGEVLGLPMLDHVITNGDKHYSFRHYSDVFDDRSLDYRRLDYGEFDWRGAKPSKPVVEPESDFGSMADWEAVKAGARQEASDLDVFRDLLASVATGDPNHAHVVFLDNALKIVALERIPKDVENFERTVVNSAGVYAASKVFVSAGTSGLLSSFAEANYLKSRLSVLSVNLIDAAMTYANGEFRSVLHT